MPETSDLPYQNVIYFTLLQPSDSMLPAQDDENIVMLQSY